MIRVTATVNLVSEEDGRRQRRELVSAVQGFREHLERLGFRAEFVVGQLRSPQELGASLRELAGYFERGQAGDGEEGV